MPSVFIGVEDLAPFASIEAGKAQAMIEDALAQAAWVAPCITSEDFAHAGAAKAIIRGAVLRWHESGSGAVPQQTQGPFSQTIDTRVQRRAMFWPSEIVDFRDLFASSAKKVFQVDTTPVDVTAPGYWSGPDTWVPYV